MYVSHLMYCYFYINVFHRSIEFQIIVYFKINLLYNDISHTSILYTFYAKLSRILSASIYFLTDLEVCFYYYSFHITLMLKEEWMQ